MWSTLYVIPETGMLKLLSGELKSSFKMILIFLHQKNRGEEAAASNKGSLEQYFYFVIFHY